MPHQAARRTLNQTYMAYLNPVQRKKLLSDLFSLPFFVQGILRRLSLLWNANEIRNLFDNVYHNLQGGFSGVSICDSLRIALEEVILILVQKAITNLSKNYGLESIMIWLKKGKSTFQDFIFHVLQSLDVPTPKKISQGYLAGLETVTHRFSVPLALPFSMHLISRLDLIWKSLSAENLDEQNKVLLFFFFKNLPYFFHIFFGSVLILSFFPFEAPQVRKVCEWKHFGWSGYHHS